MVNRCPVLLSNVIVRAPFIVVRFCSTSNVVGLVSFTIVIVPFPWLLNASIVFGLNCAPSDPEAKDNADPGVTAFPLRLLPRRSPFCE